MNLRKQFIAASNQLRADFDSAAGFSHMGIRGEIREGALRTFLANHMPTRYALGSGQVISSQGRISKQCDIVIYDATEGPRLPIGKEKALYPIESVYGIIEVKSSLSADELRGSYANIASVKSLAIPGSFIRGGPGFSVGTRNPIPWGSVFAYSAPRSIEAIAAQVGELDKESGKTVDHRPDSVAILDKGIIAPYPSPRAGQESNLYALPSMDTLNACRPTGRHTLLRFYLDMLADLGSIALMPPNLAAYVDTPQTIDGRKVRQHMVVRRSTSSAWEPDAPVYMLSDDAIRELLIVCPKDQSVTLEAALHSMLGSGIDLSNIPGQDRQRQVYLYNPRDKKHYLPFVEIDDMTYHFDVEALEEQLGSGVYFEVPDIIAEELFAFAGPIAGSRDTKR